MKRNYLIFPAIIVLSFIMNAGELINQSSKDNQNYTKKKLFPNEAILGPTDEQILQLRQSAKKHNKAHQQKFPQYHSSKLLRDPEIVAYNNKTTVSQTETAKSYDDYYIYYFRDFAGKFIFREYDSLGVWFRPQYPCKIKEVQVLFSEESDLLDQNVEICIYDIPDTLYPVNEYQSICPGNGTYDFSYYKKVIPSPQGKLYGKYPLIVSSYGYEDTDWNILDLTDFGDPIDVGIRDFFVAFQFPAGNDDSADVYYGPSDELHVVGDYHSFKWYPDGGTYSPGVPNWVSRLNYSLRVKVEYDIPVPPMFIYIKPLKRRIYYSCNPGPYFVRAGLYHGEYMPEQLSSVKLIYFLNSISDADTIDITGSQQQGDKENTNYYSGEIPSYPIGTQVWYYFIAEYIYTLPNNIGSYIIKTNPIYFEVAEATPGTSILVVKDGNATDIERYTDVLDNNGWRYDFWDTYKNGSPDLCELQHYTSLFWLQGQGTGGMLYSDSLDVNALPDYLENGGNLFLVSADYVGAAHGGDYRGVWETADHHFVTDYLKVIEYCSDANQDEDGNSSDSAYTGIDKNSISSFLFQDTLQTKPKSKYYEFQNHYANWADEVRPKEDAECSFLVFNKSENDGVTASTMYDGDYKMVFVPWLLESVQDQSKFEQIIKNVLMFFREKAAPLVKIESGPRYVVAENSGPLTVSGSVTEGDGTVIGAGLGISCDGNNFSYSDINLNNGMFIAEIPDIAVGDTLFYHIRAKDNEDLFGYSQTYMFNKINLTASKQLLYCGDDPYDWYYKSSVDSIVVSSLNRIDVHFDYYDVDDYGPPSYVGLLDHYSSVIWHGYADWEESFPANTKDNPFFPFINSGGNLLFSSEEMLGTLLGWDGYIYTTPGHAIYDVLGISWYAPDIDYDTLRIYPGSETEMLVNGLDNKLLLKDLPFGFLGDIIDPVYCSGTTPILDAWVPVWGGWYSNWSCYTVWYNDSSFKRIVLPFSLASLNDSDRDIFLNNVIDFFGIINNVDEQKQLPRQFALKQNYPNPFNPVTLIKFELPVDSDVRLTVYNMIGQKVCTLVNEHRSAGYYSIQWDGRNDFRKPLSSGIYLYQIQAGRFQKTNKMVLLK